MGKISWGLVALAMTLRTAAADTTVPKPGSDGPQTRLTVGAAKVTIVQDGREVPIVEGGATLRRAPFAIRVSLPQGAQRGLWLHAWRDDGHQQRLHEGRPLDEAFPIEANAMAEYPRNRNRDLFLSSDRYSYWYVVSDADHRFDRVRRKKGEIVATRTVSSLVVVDEGRKNQSTDRIDLE